MPLRREGPRVEVDVSFHRQGAGSVLKVGDIAPPFVADAARGGRVDLQALRGRLVVLYFFRRAFTRNCTVETKGFRDNYPELRDLGAEVIGISCDEQAKQCRFAEETEVTFPMVADTSREISKSYQAFFALLPVSHRVTYVIDADAVIIGVFNHEFQVSKHLDEVLGFVRRYVGRSALPPA